MMELYVPKYQVFHNAAELPEDLKDKRTAASVRVGVEAALDNTANLHARLSHNPFAKPPLLVEYQRGNLDRVNTWQTLRKVVNTQVSDVDMFVGGWKNQDTLMATISLILKDTTSNTYQFRVKLNNSVINVETANAGVSTIVTPYHGLVLLHRIYQFDNDGNYSDSRLTVEVKMDNVPANLPELSNIQFLAQKFERARL